MHVCGKLNMILMSSKGNIAYRIDSQRGFHTKTPVCEAWVFSYQMRNQTQTEKKNRQRGKEKNKRIRGCIVNNSHPGHRTVFI